MTIVKDPIIVKVAFEGTLICTEGRFWHTFAISTDEYDKYFNEDRSTEELPTELLKVAGLRKSMYRVEKIKCLYNGLSWEVKL